MRTLTFACALVSTSWIFACGTDPAETKHAAGGSAGSTTTTGSSGSSGHGGSSLASGGSAGAAGGSGGAAGNGGTAGNGGIAGNGGTGGTAIVEAGPVVSLCDGKAKKALPYNIMGDYKAVTTIGADGTFIISSNPQCNTPYPTLEGGTDAADDSAVTDSAAADVSVSDAATSDAATSDVKTDASPSDAGALPACYEFHYDPALCETGTCWAGVIFQPGSMSSPADAAVQKATGICIEPGATKIDFMARASRDMARIKFGSTREGMGTTEFFLNVTTQWAMYSVTIPPDELYNDGVGSVTGGVWNGFSVVVEPADHVGGTTISVKDITWKK